MLYHLITVLLQQSFMINCANVYQAVTEVLTVAALFGQHWQQVGLPHPIPIACVGCGDADKVCISLYQGIYN